MGRWRKQVHIAMGAFALLLRWLPFALSLAFAVAAIVFNVYVVPRLPAVARLIHREGERPGQLHGGIFWYPVTVLAALLLFPLPIAASGWGFLAVGDGLAAYVGERAGAPRLPWHGRKTLAGGAALLVSGTAAATFLFLFVRPNVSASSPLWRDTALLHACATVQLGTLVGLMTGVGVCAMVLESLPWRFDDNLAVCLGSAALLAAGLAVM